MRIVPKDNPYEQVQIVDPEDEQLNSPEAIDDRRIADLNYELRHFQGIADRWGARSDVTQLEACHGAVREAYATRFDETIPKATPVGDFNPNRVYDTLFDMTYADQIKDRRIRTAKELFKT